LHCRFSKVVGCDTVLSDTSLPTFRRNILPPFSRHNCEYKSVARPKIILTPKHSFAVRPVKLLTTSWKTGSRLSTRTQIFFFAIAPKPSLLFTGNQKIFPLGSDGGVRI
jgi:hypothetical protein